jgi:putative ABC transport system ATP-binding protein
MPGHIAVWPDRPADLGPSGSAATEPAPAQSAAAQPAAAERPGPAPAAAEPVVAELAVREPGPPIVEATEVTRTFGTGEAAVHALRGVSLTVREGQFVALYGRSGSGKTTLLNILGGLDVPTSGTVRTADRELTAAGDRERTAFRREEMAFVFQSFGLIPMLSAAENVGMPLRIQQVRRAEREERVRMMLSVVGLTDHAMHRPGELSGGQQQRVAIARALVGRPRLLLADEPTGQLDHETGQQIIRLLRTVVRSEGLTAIVATHDPALAALADVTITLEDGRLAPATPHVPTGTDAAAQIQ